MKNLIIIFYILVYYIPFCSAQDSFGKITSQSSDFIRYGLIPVSYFAGKANIEIPLYTLQDSDFSIPLSLSYTSDGLKPAKHHGLVGLDWILNFSGVITREVYGSPDDANGYNGYDPSTNTGYNMEKGFYQIKNDTLFCLGHENPITLIHNTIPFPLIVYPFNYEQRIEHTFESKGMHSSQRNTNTFGDISIQSDAYGKMILPSGDTLNNVTRIKTTQIINDTSNVGNNNIRPGDIRKMFLAKHLKKESRKNHKQIEANTYSWYVKGYRYPIFESVQAFETTDNLKNETFATAYFYPPVSHYYLDNDSDNMAVLDSLNNEKTTDTSTNWINRNFSYNFWPNPVSTTLNIEYKLEQEAPICITLYSSVYGTVKTIPLKHKETGLHTETIDCSALYPGAYAIKFNVRNESVSNIILKK